MAAVQKRCIEQALTLFQVARYGVPYIIFKIEYRIAPRCFYTDNILGLDKNNAIVHRNFYNVQLLFQIVAELVFFYHTKKIGKAESQIVRINRL